MRLQWIRIISLVLAINTRLYSQEDEPANSLHRYFEFEDPAPLSCLITWFPPFLIQHGMEVKDFIRSKTFKKIREKYDDVRAVDAIYIYAMRLTNNNTGVSLLLATLATMDHDMFGVKVPIIQLYVPLTSEPDEEFRRRVGRLPTQIYRDSPANQYGDRDKLQHFFGSALVAFVFESDGSAERVGEFVERGEDAFIVGGKLDNRDVRANRQGRDFGLALLENNRRLPSEFLGGRPEDDTVEHVPCDERQENIDGLSDSKHRSP